MIVQAAKIIGSGLATIGLINIILTVIRDENILISKIIKTELIKKWIVAVDSRIKSIPKNRILYKFLDTEIKGSILEIKAKSKNGYIIPENFYSLGGNTNIKLKEEKKSFQSY